MLKYTSQYQTKITQYSNLQQLKLLPTNRWVQLTNTLPLDLIIKIYFEAFTDVLIRAAVPEKIKPDKSNDRPNKGKIKLDATVADRYIRYHDDLGLLNEAREKTETMIDILFDLLRDKMPVKPRTYRSVARKKYLGEAKKKQKSKKTLRSAIRYMLNCLDGNIRSINKMLDMLTENPLKHTKWIFY